MQIHRFSIMVGIALVLALVGCSRQQEKHITSSSPAVNDIAIATTVLSTIVDDEEPQKASGRDAAKTAPQNKSIISEVVFSESGRGVAYCVMKDDKTCVVHNNNRGKQYAFVGKVVFSPDGRRMAYGAYVGQKWRMVVDGVEGKVLSTAIASPMFSPDGQHVAYQAMIDEKWHLVVDNTPNEGTKTNYNTHEFNAGSTLIAYVENQDHNRAAARLIISDLKFRRKCVKDSIGNAFISNRDKTRLAATQVVDEKVRVIDFSFAEPEIVRESPLYDSIDHLTFGNDGVSVSYVAVKGGTRLLVLDDRAEQLPQGDLRELPVIRPDKKGVGVLLASQKGFFLHQSFVNSSKKEKMYDAAAYLAYSEDGRLYVYAARKAKNYFIVVNGKEGPSFDMVVSPLVSPDGKRLVYRARKDGKRFLIVADAAGNTIKLSPGYEQVFQPVFTVDGKSVVYGVKDGNKFLSRVEIIN